MNYQYENPTKIYYIETIPVNELGFNAINGPINSIVIKMIIDHKQFRLNYRLALDCRPVFGLHEIVEKSITKKA